MDRYMISCVSGDGCALYHDCFLSSLTSANSWQQSTKWWMCWLWIEIDCMTCDKSAWDKTVCKQWHNTGNHVLCVQTHKTQSRSEPLKDAARQLAFTKLKSTNGSPLYCKLVGLESYVTYSLETPLPFLTSKTGEMFCGPIIENAAAVTTLLGISVQQRQRCHLTHLVKCY